MNNQYSIKKYINYLVIVNTLFLFGALILVAARSLFSRYIADEYCHAYIAHNKTFWEAQVYWYNAWTGKYSYNFFVTFVQLLGLHMFPFIPIFVLIIWMISLFWTLYQIFQLFKIKINIFYIVYITNAIIFTHLLSMPTIGQSFYWQSATPYTIPLVLLTIYIGIIIRCARYHLDNFLLLFSIFILAGIAGGFSETFLAMQTTLLIISLFLSIKKFGIHRENTFLLLLFAALLGSCLSLLITVIAPGNKIRQALYPPPSNLFMPALFTFVYSFYYILRSVGAFTALLFTASISPGLIKNISFEKKNAHTDIITVTVAVYIIILSCIAPNFFAISAPPFGRNLALPNFILVVYSAYIGCRVGRLLPKKYSHIAPIMLLSMLILLPMVYSYHILKILPNYKVHADQWDNQHQFILDQKNRGVKNITIKALGYTDKLEDVQKDPNHWVNDCMAKYYGIHSIKAQ